MRTDGIERLAGAVPVASGAVVMGTGIVSVGLSLDDLPGLSLALLAAAALAWVALAILLAVRAVRPPRLRGEARPQALTLVAGTAVLGARLAMLGWAWAAVVLLALALSAWLALVPRVLAHVEAPADGSAFMLAVSTESLAVLGSVLAVRERAPWLAEAALAFAVLGLAAYLLVLARFELRQLVAGRGDQWIAGGALAIAALAWGREAEAARSLAPLRPWAATLSVAALALWVAAAAWLPALVACELAVRRGGYDLRRWSTLFPVGMYAACSLVVGGVRGLPGLTDFARVWIWVAFALWLLLAAGLVRRAARAVGALAGL